MEEFKQINFSEMKQAIESSGYLIEQRVLPVLEKKGYYVQLNNVYNDPLTFKSREIDFTASKIFKSQSKRADFIFPCIIGECENNSQPVVFFKNDAISDEFLVHALKVSGIPTWVTDESGLKIFLPEYIEMERFHHYYKSHISTQYCTFTKKNNKYKWIAYHPEESHNTFQALINATRYAKSRHYESFNSSIIFDNSDIDLRIYYPLLILQGELYEAKLKNNELQLEQTDQIVFCKKIVDGLYSETFLIDVITEKYFNTYLEVLEKSFVKIVKNLSKDDPLLEATLKEITKTLSVKNKNKSLSDILDYDTSS